MKTLACGVAALLALAAPAVAKRSTRRQANLGEIPDPTDVEGWCQNIDLRDEELVGWVWNDWSVGWYMDVMISKSFSPPNEDWVVKFADQTFDNAGNSGAFGCGLRGDECFSNLNEESCAQMVRDGNGMEYWIFTAVKNMQAVYEIAHENLQDSVMESTLAVSSMVSDILPPDADPHALPGPQEILAYVAAAFTMLAGSSAYAAPYTRMYAGIAGGTAATASLVVAQDPALINTASIDTALQTAFRETRIALDAQLALAVGGGGDYTTLADAGDWYSPISSFFNAGKFLLQGNPDNIFSDAYALIQRSLVDYTLNLNDYAVLGKEGITEEECSNEGDEYGAHWLTGVNGGHCFQLHQYTFDNRFNEMNWLPVPADLIDKLQNNYHINMIEYYQAAYDCAVSGSGAPDVGNLGDDGSIPLCFYRIKCQNSDSSSVRPPGPDYDYEEDYRVAFDWGSEAPW